MEKNIKNEHFIIIREMIRGYNEIHNKISNCESKINKIKDKTKFLTDSLSQMRREELEFFSNLEKIYGPGKFDPQKNKWILFDEQTIE